MKITYDPEVDALYIRLVDGQHQCRTLRLTDQISLNIGDQETLVGIEILDAKELLGHGSIPPLVLENLPSVQRSRGDYRALKRELRHEIHRAYDRAGQRGGRRDKCTIEDFAAGYVAAHLAT